MTTWRDALARHLGLGAEEKYEVYRSVAASAALRDFSYWAEIVFSAGIATLGLTLGSPAVIIGAMLISPLMGPILSTGLALAAGDFVLAARSMSAVAMSSLAAVVFSTVLVILLPFREMTAEIASRTQPNTLDLIIALLSGAVGALAVARSVRGVATSIPGVAIAVALMPPLCVTGYGIGVLVTVDRVQGLSVLRGGALLFITNLVAITFASMLVFLALHIDSEVVRRRVREENGERAGLPRELARIGSLPARLLIVGVMVVTVFVPLKRSFDALVQEIRNRQQLNVVQKESLNAWEELFGRSAAGQPRSYVDRFEAIERDGKLQLAVRVFTAESVSETERRAYVQRLARELGRPEDSFALTLVEIPTSQYKVATAKSEQPAPAPPTLGERLARVADEASRAAAGVPLPASARILGADLTLSQGTPRVTLVYLSPEPLSGDAGELVSRSVRERLELVAADVRFAWVPERLSIPAADPADQVAEEARAQLARVAEAVRREPGLRVVLTSGPEGQVQSAATAAALQSYGIPEAAIELRTAEAASDGSVEVHVSRPEA